MVPASSREVARTSTAPGTGASARRASPPAAPKWSRRRGVLGVFAALSVLGFVGAYVGPTGAALAEAPPAVAPMSVYSTAVLGAQSYQVETVAEGEPAEESMLPEFLGGSRRLADEVRVARATAAYWTAPAPRALR